LEKYKRDLILRGNSKQTFKNYLLSVKKASDSKVRQVYSALKYFYSQTLGRPWDEMQIPQLRKKKKLPVCFTFIGLTDIKRDRMRLLISQGKGSRDRYTILSENCLSLLENYWRLYKPELWLFPGRNGKQLSTRACQHAFYLAKEKAGIKQEGGIHILRHSFATHFLESGGGLFQLQKFMGHKCLKTTLVYAHSRL